ncbi:thiolase family protein [Rhodococcus sp. IEGM 1305]|uniref:thiolase family protein n=1 Tax=Rhodococcus sp. IEGM 1305 TaxID=3047092 RepID=UPI0024B65ADF|nr:thiolase family protein [Rhodococcus sp. IEGM 1305]MDI9947704.1 thiolase family protein [Rhodococcus sp. IEGM 1305]
MRDAVIVDAVRSPVGKRNGALASVHPVDLSAMVLEALAARNDLDPTLVEDVIWGCVSQVGEQSGNLGRFAVLGAGWPEDIPAVTIDRQCGSSQQAVHFAAAGVMSGQYDIAVAGGVELMSRVPMGSPRRAGFGEPYGPKALARYDGIEFNQGVSAETIARRWGFSRTDLDQHALESHAKTAEAIDAGRFKNEIAPIEVTGEDGTSSVVDTDEGVRRGGSLESLAKLKPAFSEDGVITAANSSQISDGASALLITTSERARQLGWKPLARLHSFALAGVDPVLMLTGPIPATEKVLGKAGLGIADIGAFEVNEAFASVSMAWLAETGADPTRLNPNGGAIALGHPLGASGGRLMTTLVHHMKANGIRYGLQTMCEGGGMANATILELLNH